jgi:hypothetical protein
VVLANCAWDTAGNHCSMLGAFAPQISANKLGTVIHDMHSHAGPAGCFWGRPFPIVTYLQRNPLRCVGELNNEVPRPAILDGVVDRLLSNSVQMGGGRHVATQTGRLQLAATSQIVPLRDRGGEFFQVVPPC